MAIKRHQENIRPLSDKLQAPSVSDWRKIFLTPYEEPWQAIKDCSDEQYFDLQCYPVILDQVSVEKRQAEGYFFDDEITEENADKVRFVRVRSFEAVRPSPWDMDGCEEMSNAQLFRKRMMDGRMEAFVFPTGFGLPNLEKVIGDFTVVGICNVRDTGLENVREVTGHVSVFNCSLNFRMSRLEKADGILVTGSEVDFDSLDDVRSVKIMSSSNVTFNSLRKAGDIEVFDSSIECPYLKTAGMIDFHNNGSLVVMEMPRLQEAQTLRLSAVSEKFGGKYSKPDDIELPSLKKVQNYINVRGKQDLRCPVLEFAGGLLFHSDGVAHMPALERIGAKYASGHKFGSLELSKSKSVDLSSLKEVFGDFELCNGVIAKLYSLQKVHGSLDVNCGHWISVGSNGIIREPVDDSSKHLFRMDSLKSVGACLSLHANSVLYAPQLKKVGETLNMFRNTKINTNSYFTVARLGAKLSSDAMVRTKEIKNSL